MKYLQLFENYITSLSTFNENYKITSKDYKNYGIVFASENDARDVMVYINDHDNFLQYDSIHVLNKKESGYTHAVFVIVDGDEGYDNLENIGYDAKVKVKVVQK
jgi:hypothetical protein